MAERPRIDLARTIDIPAKPFDAARVYLPILLSSGRYSALFLEKPPVRYRPSGAIPLCAHLSHSMLICITHDAVAHLRS